MQSFSVVNEKLFNTLNMPWEDLLNDGGEINIHFRQNIRVCNNLSSLASNNAQNADINSSGMVFHPR